MQDAAVTIRFQRPSLGNVKGADGKFRLPRDNQQQLIFLPSWQRANMGLASRVLGRHHEGAIRIHWETRLQGPDGGPQWYRRFYDHGRHYALHEAFLAGQTITLYCRLPPGLTAEDLHQLMELAGRYRGLSPFHPGEFGGFEVVEVRDRYGGQVLESAVR